MKYLASPPGEWLHPEDHEPPKGSKILMLNQGGTLAIGIWGEGMAVWMPLPKLSKDMKERLRSEGRLR